MYNAIIEKISQLVALATWVKRLNFDFTIDI